MDVKIETSDIPQWKKDLINKLRNQNKALATTSSTAIVAVVKTTSDSQQNYPVSLVLARPASDEQYIVNGSPVKKIKMVQDRVWNDIKNDTLNEVMTENYHSNGYYKDSGSESEEDLHYGPGIVKKLKNRYLSLALRESTNRPSILHLRKATSLENLLDDDINKNNENQQLQTKIYETDTSYKNVPGRYLPRQGRGEMKRARSVETISPFDNNSGPVITNNRQSLHEDMLSVTTTGSEMTQKLSNLVVAHEHSNNNFGQRINRPKKLQPIMSEKEKPPVDFVKQAKLIFERRPEQRTKRPPLTGEVAAKVGNFNNIIIKAKADAKIAKKYPVKTVSEKNKSIVKTVPLQDDNTKLIPPKHLEVKKDITKDRVILSSPIPDVSRVDFSSQGEHDHNNLSETPDLILTSSPLSNVLPNHKKSQNGFLKEEILNTSPVSNKFSDNLNNSSKAKTFDEPIRMIVSPTKKVTSPILDSSRKTASQWEIRPTKLNTPLDSPTKNETVSISISRDSSPVKKISSPLLSPNRVKSASPVLSSIFNRPVSPVIATNTFQPSLSISKNYIASNQSKDETDKISPVMSPRHSIESDDVPHSHNYKMVSPTSINNIAEQTSSSVFNFIDKPIYQGHLPLNKNISSINIPHSEPLQIDINVSSHVEVKDQIVGSPKLSQKTQREQPISPPKFSPPPPHSKSDNSSDKVLNLSVIKKNELNTVKTLQQPSVNVEPLSVEVVIGNIVPKNLRPREQNSNTAVFNFTNRKDVPDYIANDKSRTANRPEIPKTGEGGIILLSSNLEMYRDEDEEILRSLEGPPSPCDVTFINDNILIDGKSSLSQRNKRTKLKISFVESGPDVYEYPSETSLLLEEDSLTLSSVPVGHAVPNLGGSFLATYTPKATEDFLPGITRSVQPITNIPDKPDDAEVDSVSDLLLQEADKPFSSGTNSDILF